MDQGKNRPSPVYVFIGTYTEKEGHPSEGIYTYRLDLPTGRLEKVGATGGVTNPSFLALDSARGRLLAVDEVSQFQGQPGGGLTAFALDPLPAGLRLLNAQPTLGLDPCYVSLDASGRFALVANYTSGSASLFPLGEDGQLERASDHIQYHGAGPNPERQEGPHVHCILPDPTNRFVLATDLGRDKVLVYRLDLEGGRLKPHGEVDLTPGSGPRHLRFHPNGRWLYLIRELDSALTLFHVDSTAGKLSEVQTLSTLPPDYLGANTAAEVQVSASGWFLYASNRGHDSLATYAIDAETGRLTLLGHISSGGQTPRHFAIDPSGKYLLAANQDTDNVVTFRIAPDTGMPVETGLEVQVPAPVCVKFL